MVLVKRFHLVEKHQSPDQEEIRQAVHWAADDSAKTSKQVCHPHDICRHYSHGLIPVMAKEQVKILHQRGR